MSVLSVGVLRDVRVIPSPQRFMGYGCLHREAYWTVLALSLTDVVGVVGVMDVGDVFRGVREVREACGSSEWEPEIL